MEEDKNTHSSFWKWIKKLLQSLNFPSVKSQIPLKKCDLILSNKNLHLTHVKNAVQPSGLQPDQLQSVDRSLALLRRVGHLDKSSHPCNWKGMAYTVCYAHNKKRHWIQTQCGKCNVWLCHMSTGMGHFTQLSLWLLNARFWFDSQKFNKFLSPPIKSIWSQRFALTCR